MKPFKPYWTGEEKGCTNRTLTPEWLRSIWTAQKKIWQIARNGRNRLLLILIRPQLWLQRTRSSWKVQWTALTAWEITRSRAAQTTKKLWVLGKLRSLFCKAAPSRLKGTCEATRHSQLRKVSNPGSRGFDGKSRLGAGRHRSGFLSRLHAENVTSAYSANRKKNQTTSRIPFSLHPSELRLTVNPRK